MKHFSLTLNGNSTLSELAIELLESSGLVEAIKKIVREALAEKKPENEKKIDDGNPFYTRTELLRLTHLTETTLYRLEKAGVIKKIKMGRRNLYSRLEIDALLGSGGFHFPTKKEKEGKK